MINLLMPIHVSQVDLACSLVVEPDSAGFPQERIEGTLLDAVKRTDIHYRIVVTVEGGSRSDLWCLDSYLQSQRDPWKLVHEPRILGPWHLINDVAPDLDHKTHPLTAIIPPWIRILDERWIMKVQRVFQTDHRAMLVSALAEPGKSWTLPPNRFGQHEHPSGELWVCKTAALQDMKPESLVDFSKKVHQAGGTRWLHPGIEFQRDDEDLRTTKARPAAHRDR
jgi:hypothetical protein